MMLLILHNALFSRSVSFVTPPHDNSSLASFRFVLWLFFIPESRALTSSLHICFSRHALHHLTLRVFLFEPVDEQRSAAFSSLPRSDDLHLKLVTLELWVLTDQSWIVIVESAARWRLF